jgi:hypothetical protein
MPVDPQIQALLDKGTGVPATHTLPVDVARGSILNRWVKCCGSPPRDRGSPVPVPSLSTWSSPVNGWRMEDVWTHEREGQVRGPCDP